MGRRRLSDRSSSAKGWKPRSQALDAANLAATLRAQLASPGPVDLLLLIQPRETRTTPPSPACSRPRSGRLAKSPGASTNSAPAWRSGSRPSPRHPRRVALCPGDLRRRPSRGGRPGGRGPGEARRRARPWSVSKSASGPTRDSGSKPLASLASGSSPASAPRPELAARSGLEDPRRSRPRSRRSPDRPGLDARHAPRIRPGRARPGRPGGRRGRSGRGCSTRSWQGPPAPKAEPGQEGRRARRHARPLRAGLKAGEARRAAGGCSRFSLKAALEPLRGGPPVVPLTIRASNNGVLVRNPADRAKEQAIDKAVEARISELEAVWEEQPRPGRRGLPRCSATSSCPKAARPRSSPIPGRSARRAPSDRGASPALLVRWAIRADRAADLREAVEGAPQADHGRGRRPVDPRPARPRPPRLRRGEQRVAGARGPRRQGQAPVDRRDSPAWPPCPHWRPRDRGRRSAGPRGLDRELRLVGGRERGGQACRSRAGPSPLREPVAPRRAAIGSRPLSRPSNAPRPRASRRIATTGAAFQTRRENLQVVAAEYARAASGTRRSRPSASRPTRRSPRTEGQRPARPSRSSPSPGTWPRSPLRSATRSSGPGRCPMRPERPSGSSPRSPRSNLPPEAFGRSVAIGDGSGLVSTMELLVSAAKDAGKLDELAARGPPAVEKKREDAEALWTLVEIARGQGGRGRAGAEGPACRVVEEGRRGRRRRSSATRRPSRPPGPIYLRVRAALADPKLADLGRKLAGTPKLEADRS